jgi:hypothetical protein
VLAGRRPRHPVGWLLLALGLPLIAAGVVLLVAGIEASGTRLRQQVDLDTLTADLLAVVDRTVQPARSSLWLRPPELSAPTVAAASRQRG